MPKANASTAVVELDLGRYELRRNGRRVKLEKKPMELLIFLATRREQLVSREEIVKRLWRSDLFIDPEHNVNNIVRKLRTVLRDHSRRPRFLETVVGKGYRFIGPIRVISAHYPGPDADEGFPHSIASSHAHVRGQQPSLAIMPLVLLGKTSDDHGLCLGFADAMVSRLGNLRGINVLPIAMVVNLPPASPSEIAALLATRYVVHGAVQFSKGQWRLAVEMFDASTHRACFSRKCDIEMVRLPELEKDIAKGIAGTLKRPLEPATALQHTRYSRDQLAYAEFMRGYRLSASGDTSLTERQAITLPTRSCAIRRLLSPMRCSPKSMRVAISNSIPPVFGWRRLNSTVPAPSNLTQTYRRGGLRVLSCCGDRLRTFSISRRLPNSNAPCGFRKTCLMLTTASGPSWRTLDCSIALARCMKAGALFIPKQRISPSVVQVYVWGQQYEPARESIDAWRGENPTNKYAIYFAPQPAMMTGHWEEAELFWTKRCGFCPTNL